MNTRKDTLAFDDLISARAILLISLCLVINLSARPLLAQAQTWQALNRPPTPEKIDLITAQPDAAHNLFVGAGGRLYASSDDGKTWKESALFTPHSTVRQIYFTDVSNMFVPTSDGLWSSTNGKNWMKTFGGINPKEQNARAIGADSERTRHFYLGTEGGLFKSEDGGNSWFRETNVLGRQSIRHLQWVKDNGELFVASDRGLYRFIPKQRRLDRIYVTERPEGGVDTEETEAAEDPEMLLISPSKEISSLLTLPSPRNDIVIADSDGIHASDDEGNHWTTLPSAGLGNAFVNDLAYSPATDTLFAATDKGVFSLSANNSRWNELYAGLAHPEVKQLELAGNMPEILYALTRDGISQMPLDPISEIRQAHVDIPASRLTSLSKLFDLEPSVQNIQKQAIRYSNTNNWKTRRWQVGSRLRALVPTFSVGKSFSTNNNIDIDRGGTNDPDQFIAGPSDMDRSWDFDLSWDLGDLIWNSAQTSIDSREKMMVELRNDVLSEVTRLYFERRRAQTEFILNPPQDALEQTQALLRIDELTANIDSLTGGYLTKTLGQVYGQNPGLKELWHLNL